MHHASAGIGAGQAAAPVPLLIDTDIFSDVDDVGALAVAHILADEGSASFAAILVNTPSRWGHQAVRVINSYYGRPDIVIGALLPLDDSVAANDYARHLASTYPTGAIEPEDAVRVARRCLQEAEDGSIVVVSLGFFGNLVGLLDSQADDISPVSGHELIERKVARTVVMGGLFPNGWEFNVGQYPAVAARFVDSWPVGIEFLGWEVGAGVITGRELSRDGGADNPVSEAYRVFNGAGTGRDSWDLMTVALAVHGPLEDYEYSQPGRVSVLPNGETLWHEHPDGNHRYVILLAPTIEITARIDGYLATTPVGRQQLAPSTGWGLPA